jgi:NAD(P)H-dependent FMN reductase
MKQLTLVLGTAREGRESEKVAKLLHTAFSAKDGVAVTYVDIRDHLTEPRTIRRKDTTTDAYARWQEIVVHTDAFVFVIPEYHRGYPGEWKLFIDSLETEYRDKQAYIVGVSNGIFAGVRMGEHIKPVLIELGFVLSRVALYIGNVDTVFGGDGSVADAATATRLKKFVDDVLARI